MKLREHDSLLAPDHWLAAVSGMGCFALDASRGRLADDAVVGSLRAQLEAASSDNAAFAYARIPVEGVALAARLGRAGFRLIDTSVRFSHDGSAAPSGNGAVRVGTLQDRARIVAIASTCFRLSRFHLDPLFPPRLADRIKGAWMESYFDGKRGSEVLVADAGPGPAGFLAVLPRTGVQNSEAVIDLIGVDPTHQHKGLGAAMVAEFIARWRTRVSCLSVGTQIANLPSIRLYEQYGFRLSGSAYVLHAHYRDGKLA